MNQYKVFCNLNSIFFISYRTAPRLTLGDYEEAASLTPMLITALLSNLAQRSPRPKRMRQWGSNQKLSNSESRHYTTVPLSSRLLNIDFVSSSFTCVLTLFMMFYGHWVQDAIQRWQSNTGVKLRSD